MTLIITKPSLPFPVCIIFSYIFIFEFCYSNISYSITFCFVIQSSVYYVMIFLLFTHFASMQQNEVSQSLGERNSIKITNQFILALSQMAIIKTKHKKIQKKIG